MIKRIFYIIPFLILALTACNKHISNGVNSNDIGKKENAEKIGYYYALTKATHDRILGNYNEAIQSLNLCIKYNNKSDAAYYQLSIIYFSMNNIQEALDNAKKATELDPENIWYQYQIASIHNHQKNNNGIIEAYKAIIEYHPEKYNIYFDLVNLYMNEKDEENALKTLVKLEEKIGINEQIALASEQIYSSQGKFNEAIEVMEKFIESNPYEVKHIGILAELYLIVNKEEEAFEQFKKLFEMDENNGIAKLSVATYYRQKQNYDSSFVYYQDVYKNEDVSLDMKIRELVNFITNPIELQKHDTSIVKLLNILDSNYYDDLKVRTLRADYNIRTQNFTDAQKELTYVIEKEKNNYVVWEQLLIVDQRNNDYESLLKHSKEAIKSFSDVPTLYYFQGLAYYELDQLDNAIKTYFKGLDYVNKNRSLKIQFYIQIAETYNKKNEYDSSDDYFEKSLLIDPNNTLVINNYSYYLSLRAEKLERAEELCKRLIVLDGNSYAYLDTYAWVLYKKGNFEQALKIIEKAYYNGGAKDHVILDHYGDILKMNNKNDEAIKYWEMSILIQKSEEVRKKILNAKGDE